MVTFGVLWRDAGAFHSASLSPLAQTALLEMRDEAVRARLERVSLVASPSALWPGVSTLPYPVTR